MAEERKQETISALQNIYDNYIFEEWESEPSMFGLISRYNQTGQNVELIGGDWVVENCPSPLKDLT